MQKHNDVWLSIYCCYYTCCLWFLPHTGWFVWRFGLSRLYCALPLGFCERYSSLFGKDCMDLWHRLWPEHVHVVSVQTGEHIKPYQSVRLARFNVSYVFGLFPYVDWLIALQQGQKPLPLLRSYTISFWESQLVIRNWTVHPTGMSEGSPLANLAITWSTLLKPVSVNSDTTFPLK